MDKITYWLWFGKRIVYALRLPKGIYAERVKEIALEKYRRIPIEHIDVDNPCLPPAWEWMIKNAEVVVYPNGN